MNDDKDLLKGPAQLLALLRQSQKFAESLLKDNEEVRLKLAVVEEKCTAAEAERDRLRERFSEITQHTSASLTDLQAIEEQLNAMANLHVASWQLHSTLQLPQVLNTVQEICINLVGVHGIAVFLLDEKDGRLMPVAAADMTVPSEIGLEQGVVGKAAAQRHLYVREGAGASSIENPLVVIPLALGERVIGAVAILGLLPQKAQLTPLDFQIFALLEEQAASAIYSAYLAGTNPPAIRRETLREHALA